MTTIDTDDQAQGGLLTAGQVCSRLKICRTTLTHLVALRPVHIGRAVRWPRGEVANYELGLARQRDGRARPGRPRSSN